MLLYVSCVCLSCDDSHTAGLTGVQFQVVLDALADHSSGDYRRNREWDCA
jgi:hypothetical protein